MIGYFTIYISELFYSLLKPFTIPEVYGNMKQGTRSMEKGVIMNTDKKPKKSIAPPDMKNLMWEEVSTEHIVQDEWIDFRKSAYRFPDGSVFEPSYSYSRRDYVVIAASDEDGNYLCVRQFRQGIQEVELMSAISSSSVFPYFPDVKRLKYSYAQMGRFLYFPDV